MGVAIRERRAGAAETKARLEQLLRERALAVAARAAELAALSKMPSALATDPETVRDLTDKELPLALGEGESITLAQRFGDGRQAVLLSVPEENAAKIAALGGSAGLRDGQLVLSHAVRVVPTERAQELSGIVVVSSIVQARAILATLPAWSPGAKLNVGEDALALGASGAAGPGIAVPIAFPGGLDGSLVLADAGRTRRAVLGAGAGVLALLSLALSLSARRRAHDAERPIRLATPPVTSVTPVPPATELDVALAPELPAKSAANPRIGRYTVVRKLGEGGMADVFLARFEGEAGFGKLVALKVLQPSFAAHPVAVELFLDEARLVATLDHPNIVQIHDLGRANERYFIAMEYVDGSDLGRMLEALRARDECVAVPYALAILCRLCDGLHAAHVARGPDGAPMHIVHRDVKSANVFLARTGAVKIGDFGIAKATHALRASRTEMGQVKGTPDYMPPEQRLGLDVDARTDVYGVGAVAYEMLSGRHVNLDYVALAGRGLQGWPHLPRLTTLRADVPVALDDLVFKALSYERGDRFANCADFEHALQTVASAVGMATDKDLGGWVRTELDARPAKTSKYDHLAKV